MLCEDEELLKAVMQWLASRTWSVHGAEGPLGSNARKPGPEDLADVFGDWWSISANASMG